MPQQVTANDGDTLCSIAIANGFLDCGPIRNLSDNAGKPFLNAPLQAGDIVAVPDLDTSKKESKADKQQHQFVKKGADPVTIRFVHGSPDKHYADDDTLDKLIVSKYITDKGGNPDGSADLPDDSVCEFNQNGDADIDTFKVEVFEPNKESQQLDVTIEALKPVFDASGNLTNHVPFDGSLGDATSERGKRSLKVTAKKVGQSATHRCRTPYLRLVVDEADKSGTVGPVAAGGFQPATTNNPKPKQTVLVTDMVDQNDDTIEILDQVVRASTPFPRCTQSGDNQCVASVTLPIGNDRQRLRVAVHVVKTTVGGAGIVTAANAKRRVLKWCRRIFAQANIAPKLLQVREVDPVENLICISDAPQNGPANAGGRRAAGDGTLGFTINATGKASQVVGPITPPANQDALTTATQLAGLVQAPYTATVSPNPRRFNDALASCDILITEASGAPVSFSTPVVSNDSAQTLTVGSVNPLPAANQSWDGFNFLVGTAHQRVLCKNYDTGDDRIDVFVIRATTDGNRGEAMMDGHSIVAPADQHGVPGVRFSLFVIQSAMNAGDNDPLVLSHEMGHVAAEVLHAGNADTKKGPKTEQQQLMHANVTGNNAVGSSKRIRNAGVKYDNSGAGNFNFIERIRSEGAGLLEGW